MVLGRQALELRRAMPGPNAPTRPKTTKIRKNWIIGGKCKMLGMAVRRCEDRKFETERKA